MLKILKLLNEKKDIIKKYEVLEFKWRKDFYFIKIKCYIKDGSILFIRESLIGKERKYSYHWQNKKGELICRWDNAPYHKNISTFPHHVHFKGKVRSSYNFNIESVFKFIEECIKGK